MHPKVRLQIVCTTRRKLCQLSKTLRGISLGCNQTYESDEATNLTTWHEFAKHAELLVTVLQKRDLLYQRSRLKPQLTKLQF
jgi:hypothetical protein